MPFKSGKQRRYLWANEPEIARDWTDRYGARGGGIMDMASDGNLIHDFENYKKGNSVNVPTSFQARSHSTPVNLAYITDDEAGILQSLKPGTPHRGPMEIPNYDDYSPTGGYRSGATMSGIETGAKNERARADRRAAGISPQEAAGIRGGAVAARAQSQQGRFGGLKTGFFGGLKNVVGKLRGWNEQYGRYNTQDEYNKARTKRQDRSRIDRLRKTRDYGKYANDPQGWAASDLSGRLTGLEKDVFGKDYVDYGRTALKARDLKALRDKQALTSQLSTKSPVNLNPTWDAHRNMTHANAPQSIKDFYTNSFRSRYDDQGLASLNNQWSGPQIQQARVNEDQMKTINQMAEMYGKVNADASGTPGKLDTTAQKEIFDAAKQQDTKEKEKVFGFIPGTGQEADPMTQQEYRDYLSSQGYI